jgi:tetratricopeptide (TPR) repeat protein
MSQQDQFKAKGNEFFKNQDFKTAIEWYTKAIEVDPNVEAAAALYSNRAASHNSLGDFKAAIADADNCIRVKPQWLKGHYRKATALEATGELDAAVRAYEAALKTDPTNDEVITKVTDMRSSVKARNDKAKPSLCKTSAEAKTIGNSFFGGGRYDIATDFYTRAIALADESGVSPDEKANFFANRAACRQQIYDFEGLVSDCNAALLLVPTHVKALVRRANAYESLEKWQKALDDFTRVNQLSPGMSNVGLGVVRCQRALRNQ